MNNKIVLLVDPDDHDSANPRTKVISEEAYYKDPDNNRLKLAKEFISSNTDTNVEALLINFGSYHHEKCVMQNEQETEWYRATPEDIISYLTFLSRRKSTADLSENLSKIPIFSRLQSVSGSRRRSLSVTEYTHMFKRESSVASDYNDPDDLPASFHDSDDSIISGSDSLEEYMKNNNQEPYDYIESFRKFRTHNSPHEVVLSEERSPSSSQGSSLPSSNSHHDSLSRFTFVAEDGMTFTGSGSQEDLSLMTSLGSQAKSTGTLKPAVTKIPRPKPKLSASGQDQTRSRSDSRLGTFIPISNAQETTVLLQGLDQDFQARQQYYLCKNRTQGGAIIIILIAILLSLWYIIWVTSGTWHPF